MSLEFLSRHAPVLQRASATRRSIAARAACLALGVALWGSRLWAMPDGLALPCGGCHELVGGPVIALNIDATSVELGASVTIVADLRTTKADALRTGLWLTADGGEFQLVEPNTKLDSPTSVLHSAPRDLVAGAAQISFGWTAPLVPGVTEFLAWSIVGNTNGTPRDDPFTVMTFAVAHGCEGRAFYPDTDGDGFGDATGRVFTCDAPPVGLIEGGGDCDDRSNERSPGVAEVCNGLDDNCDGVFDEGFSPTLLYRDLDGDGFGTIGGEVQFGCELEGLAAAAGDCSDVNAAAFPGAIEVDNGLDDDCNGDIDDIGGRNDGGGAIAAEPGGSGCAMGRPGSRTQRGIGMLAALLASALMMRRRSVAAAPRRTPEA